MARRRKLKRRALRRKAPLLLVPVVFAAALALGSAYFFLSRAAPLNQCDVLVYNNVKEHTEVLESILVQLPVALLRRGPRGSQLECGKTRDNPITFDVSLPSAGRGAEAFRSDLLRRYGDGKPFPGPGPGDWRALRSVTLVSTLAALRRYLFGQKLVG